MFTDLDSKFYTLILGALLMLSVYHILIFIKNKKKVYLYYSLYAFSLSLYLIERLPGDPLNFHLINPSIQFVVFAFYILFAKHLLETRENHPIIDRYFDVFQKALLIIAFLFLVIHIGFEHNVQLKIYFFIIPLFIITCMIVYWQLFKLKGPYVKYFIMGSLFYFIFTSLSFILTPTTGLIQESWIYKRGFHPLFPMFIGVIIENFVFAILVGHKVKEIEVKNAVFKKDLVIEKQKMSNLLQQQELASINAMIEGQEKERLLIANDLHDDLGSHMATIKMYFSSFKDKDSKNLFDKTNTLIEEAYQKIRNIAHIKNSGVLAKQGLLKAVKDLARNISKSEQVKVKVYDNGLDQRFENSLELTLFRIIQELIANVIKHADATKVDIHLSEDDNMLNIMIEDNGKGFDASQITKNKKGMGLSSIDRRVEDLDGKMIIESQPNSGTSVIIELPL